MKWENGGMGKGGLEFTFSFPKGQSGLDVDQCQRYSASLKTSTTSLTLKRGRWLAFVLHSDFMPSVLRCETFSLCLGERAVSSCLSLRRRVSSSIISMFIWMLSQVLDDDDRPSINLARHFIFFRNFSRCSLAGSCVLHFNFILLCLDIYSVILTSLQLYILILHLKCQVRYT